MGKVLAIMVGVAAAAGGATYALFAYSNPYRCDLASCDVATQRCCALPTEDASQATSPDAAMAVAGPVGMFVSAPAADGCCAVVSSRVVAKPVCCAAAEACCAPATACCAGTGSLAALVGPAAVR